MICPKCGKETIQGNLYQRISATEDKYYMGEICYDCKVIVKGLGLLQTIDCFILDEENAIEGVGITDENEEGATLELREKS